MVSLGRGKKNDQAGEWSKRIAFSEHEFQQVNMEWGPCKLRAQSKHS